MKLVVTKDDLTPEVDADETVKFSFDGVRYSIDLTTQHADGFAREMEHWIAAATVETSHSGRRADSAPVDIAGVGTVGPVTGLEIPYAYVPRERGGGNHLRGNLDWHRRADTDARRADRRIP